MKNNKNKNKDNRLSLIYKDTVLFFEENAEEFPVILPVVFPLKKYISVPIFCNFTTSVVEVTKEDSLVMAERYILEDLNPLVLNFASDSSPGGGVKRGSKAQEEELFRRSNYFMSLNKNNVDYPLCDKIIYSPNIYIAKTSDEYKWMKNFFKISFIAAAAIRNPQIYIDFEKKERFSKIEDKEFMKNSIFSIFDIAISLGYNSLILGAWGCGAFAGPRDDIVDIFREVILTRGNKFNKIGFGVLVRNSNDFNNFKIFQKLKELNKKNIKK